MANRATALLLASHPGPTAVVTVVGAVLGIGLGYPAWRVLLLALVVLSGQLSIGWSNDWIDAARDTEVRRSDKPVASGSVSATVVRTAAFCAVAATILLSLVLGPWAALANLVCVGMGWIYNLGVKSTIASVVPYLVCFGTLPAVATLGQESPRLAAPWVFAVGALLGAAAHFTNVLPDLEDDRRTGIRGLPHLLGLRASGITAFLCLVAGAVLLAFGPGMSPGPFLWIGLAIGVAIGVTGIVLTLRARPTRFLMRLIMAAAIVDVILLALAGQSMVL